MVDSIEKIWGKRAVRYVILTLLAAMALISLIQGVRNAAQSSQDFQWDAAKALSMGLDPYDLSEDPQKAYEYPALNDFYRLYTDKGLKQNMEANQFPSLLLLLLPYTLMTPLTARYAFLISNLIFTAGIIFLLRRTFLKDADRDTFITFMLLMIAGTPYRNQLGVGQHTLFAFFFFLLAVWLEGMYPLPDTDGNAAGKRKRGRLFAATVISLFICYFKYTLTVPLCLYFIYKKRYLEIAVSAAGHVILTAVCAVWLNESFVNMIIKPLKVSSALSAEGGLDFGALLGGSALAYVLAFAVMAGLFVIAIKLPDNMDGEFISALTLWSLIITYHRTYDFFVIVTVLAFFLGYFGKHPDQGMALRFLAAGYAITIISVFFVLRIFSESTVSKIVVGTIYYIFTISLTAAMKTGGRFFCLHRKKDGECRE